MSLVSTGPEDERFFKVFFIWELDPPEVTIDKKVIVFSRTYDIQINDMLIAIRRVWLDVAWDDIRLYGRVGDDLIRIKNYITLHCALCLMAANNSDILYVIRFHKGSVTLDELVLRKHLFDVKLEIKDRKMIFEKCDDEGFDSGGWCPLRVEHIPSYGDYREQSEIYSATDVVTLSRKKDKKKK